MPNAASLRPRRARTAGWTYDRFCHHPALGDDVVRSTVGSGGDHLRAGSLAVVAFSSAVTALLRGGSDVAAGSLVSAA